MNRSAAVFVVVAVLAAFLGGGLLHSILPHDHGHSHGSDVVWQTLHASLRHDDKQSILPMFSLVVIALLAAAAVSERRPAYAPVTAHDLFLHRGRAQYRKFG